MLVLLVVLTVVEVLLLVVVLAAYLAKVRSHLRSAADSFAKITFGVRAIERQLGDVGPNLVELNDGLQAIAARLPAAAGRGRG